MKFSDIQYILTDIEGTTTSVSFVYDTLFPYFRNNIAKLKELEDLPEVQEAFQQVIKLSAEAGVDISTTAEIIAALERWSAADQKITPLKTLQGILWKEAYVSGEIKGHIFEDVPQSLAQWKKQGVQLGVFSSGSVAAQKLIFGYSEAGDLAQFFSNYFDTNTGGKREIETYQKIAATLKIKAANILFLSDITEELEAAEAAGYQTVQLVRESTTANWKKTATSFAEILV